MPVSAFYFYFLFLFYPLNRFCHFISLKDRSFERLLLQQYEFSEISHCERSLFSTNEIFLLLILSYLKKCS